MKFKLSTGSSIFVGLIFLLIQEVSLANTCVGLFSSAKAPKSVASDSAIYFVMPQKVGKGELRDTTKLLGTLKRGGVNNIWLGPVHPQTAAEYGIHGKNDHGYWPSNHGQVGLDGAKALSRMVQAGKKHHVGIWMDAVVNHFGYGEKVNIYGKEISLRDSNYFIVSEDGTPLIDPRMQEISGRMTSTNDTNALIALQKELSEIPIYHLPKIKHENKFMADYLIESYGRFVDLGVAGFRIDAAKHVNMAFLKRFIRELQERGVRKHGVAPKFLLEITMHQSLTLNTMIDFLRENAVDPSGIFAIDFPLAYEARRLEDPAFRFEWLMGFLNHRWSTKQHLENLIPFVENHDFDGPIANHFVAKMTYALVDFFSSQSPIISHGLEDTTQPQRNNRNHISDVDPAADLLVVRKIIANTLGDSRKNAGSEQFSLIKADHDTLHVERKAQDNKKLVILVNKSNTGKSFSLEQFHGARVLHATSEQSNSLQPYSWIGYTSVNLPARSLLFLELNESRGTYE